MIQALQMEGYDILLKCISEKKRTKGFQFAVQAKHKQKSKEKGEAPKWAGETAQSMPKSYPSSQKTANEKERLDSSTVESLLLSLENSSDESKAGIAALCQTMHEAGKEGEVINVAYAAHEKLLEDYIAPELQAMVVLVAVQP